MSKLTNIRLPSSGFRAEYDAIAFNQSLEALQQIVLQLNSTYTPQSTENNQSRLDWFTGSSGPAFNSPLEDWDPSAYGAFADFSNQVCSAINTATPVTWNTTGYSSGVYVDGTDTSKIYFERAGVYELTFSAELHSESANAKTFYFWPRINGTNIEGSTMLNTIHDNDQRKTVSRSGIFEVEVGDYLQAMWAVDDLDADLHGQAATSFCPATPSAVITVKQVRSTMGAAISPSVVSTLTWIEYASNWETAPTLIGSNANGDIYEYTYNNGTLYRLVPTDGVSMDSFYTSHASGVLSGLVAERGMDI